MNTITIIAIIAGLLFVYIFGLYEGRSQGYRKRRKEEEQEKQQRETEPIPSPNTASGIVDDPGLLRIKNEGDSIRLELDGSRVDTSSLSADQRKRLIELLTLMRPWLEGKPNTTRTVEQVAPPAQQPAVPVRPVESEPQPTPVPVPPAQQPATVPNAKKDDKPAAAPASMISQIDSILQTHIVNTPLGARGVTLIEAPSGGVNVYVGLNRYEGIDAVPDEEVKAVIRVAIAEWERKYTPGL